MSNDGFRWRKLYSGVVSPQWHRVLEQPTRIRDPTVIVILDISGKRRDETPALHIVSRHSGASATIEYCPSQLAPSIRQQHRDGIAVAYGGEEDFKTNSKPI
jgi:hypothetical protein